MHKILPNIASPADLRDIAHDDLPRLAQEIRQCIISTVEQNGGHMASNLGVVELTLALHLAFDSPRDALIWDVSHQSYTHKLLTGRYAQFGTLRQSGGLSGFTNRDESGHDYFTVGHSSSSVSQALGLAEARRLQGCEDYTVAVLGDGALTGGPVYEALNNAGRSHAKLIVVLNDNEMSISRNVGGLSRYLAKVRAQPRYRRSKQRVERALRRIPGVGDCLAKQVSKLKDLVKRVLTGTTIFEQLGLAYIGPVDGHDMARLSAALESAKLSPRPALVHVHSTKGKGFTFAEQAPDEYHGVAPVCGVKAESFTDIFGNALCELAAGNPAICAVTAAMALGTGLSGFAAKHPARFFDVGIAEAHAVTFAAGLARQGMRPVVALYSTFMQRAFDQLHHDVALQGLPMVVAVDRAGFVGADGITHHGLYDVAMCAALPGAQVYAPVAADELRGMLQHALRDDKLSFVRYARDCAVQLAPDQSCETFDEFGSGDCAIVTYGRLVHEALQVPGVRVLRLRRVLPIDPAAVQAVLNCRRVCFFEEGIRAGGAGERFGAMLAQAGYAGEFTLNAVEGFARHASLAELLAEHQLDRAAMREASQLF
ncbi:MAG: 1-deoxy-D-xylulose-5-phosphate synthase [Oscillospiraceae bacterium]|nr:1-deoxy-D-xylulose-5-phosphate synthase [Oscillospiraceae bacterium]